MTTITEDYVSFETAKLLKEKGFNYPCRAVYSPKGIVRHYLKEEVYSHYLKGHKKLCPTLQMTMKWLRETYGIDIIIEISDPSVKDRKYYCVIWSKNNDSYILDLFDYYEEAVEAALKYCLENLI